MRFTIPKGKNSLEWHETFLYLPEIIDDKIVWLETVKRKGHYSWVLDSIVWDYELIEKEKTNGN